MLYILIIIFIIVVFIAFFKKPCNITETFKDDDTYQRINIARKNYNYPSYLKNLYKKYFKKTNSFPTAINKHIIYQKVMYVDFDKKYQNIKTILAQITKKMETKIITKRDKLLNLSVINKLAKTFISNIFNKIYNGDKYKFLKIINPISRQIINNNIIKYVIPIFIFDISGVQDPNCIQNVIQGKKSIHNYLLLVVFEFPKNDDKIFKTINNSIIATHLMGSLSEDKQSFSPKNKFDNVFDHDMHYSWLQEYKILLNKNIQKKILQDKNKKKFILTNWTGSNNYCDAKKISYDRAKDKYYK